MFPVTDKQFFEACDKAKEAILNIKNITEFELILASLENILKQAKCIKRYDYYHHNVSLVFWEGIKNHGSKI